MSRWINRPSVAMATAAAITLSTPAIASADTVAPRMNYQVRTGDSLAKISQITGIPAQSIAQANNLATDSAMRPGQHLVIPSGSFVQASKTASKTYIVKAGDTVSEIAKKYNTTVSQITKLNKLVNANRIYVGQKLIVKAGSSTAKPTVVKAANTGKTYTVKAGDTLSAIAVKHGTPVAKLVELNSIKNANMIRIGQTLKLSGTTSTKTAAKATPKSTGKTTPKSLGKVTEKPKTSATAKNTSRSSTTYTVKSGDTLSVIARKYNTTVSALANANNISNPSRIYVGQKLTIGDASASTSATKSTQTLVQNNFPGYTYPEATVSAANSNKNALVNTSVPSRAQMQQKVRQTALSMGVDPKLALAHAYVESGFDMTAVSPANAIGVMQVIPSSGEWASQLVGRKLNLLDPDDNVTAGVAIIRYLQRNAYSLDQGIAGYYQGLGGVQKYGMRSDTVNYVAKVKKAMASF